MRSLWIIITVCSLVILTGAIAQVPDTTFIEADDDPLNNVGIIKAIVEADTNADGSHKDMVYILERGGVYPFDETVNTKGGYLEILGQTEPADQPPAFLTGWLKPDASGQNRNFFSHGGDITIKNLAYTTAGADNEHSLDGNLCICTSDSSTIIAQHIYGDHCGRMIDGQANYLSVFMDDILIRNGRHQYRGKNKNTLVIVSTNFTSFNAMGVGCIASGPRGLVLDSCYFEHATTAISRQGMLTWGTPSNLVAQNLIGYDIKYRGDNYDALINRPVDCEGNPHVDCDFQWRKLDSTELATLGIDSSGRRIQLDCIDWYSSEALRNFYDSQDSMWIAGAIRPTMYCDYADNPGYPLVTIENFIQEDPQFVSMPHDISVNFDKILDERGQPAGPPADRYFHDFDGDDSPLTLAWPITVGGLDLTVQNPNLINSGTDGLNFGDLRWAEGQYEQWLQMHAGEWPTTEGVATEVADKPDMAPSTFELLQNYPNPFNPNTTIGFKLDKPAEVSLTVYNVMGQKVNTLVDEKLSTGSHKVQWNGQDENGLNVTSGVYYYQITAQEYSVTRKMILLK